MQVNGATTAILSYVKYPAVAANRSYGIFPNNDSAGYQVFNTPTPGATNSGSLAGALKINEWMPSNTTTIADPADGDFEDWIEIYNASASTVFLTGCTLTDDPSKPNQWTFPVGTSIAPGGFLLVWADDEGAQAGLHASFKLSASGEQILLYDPSGTLLDNVTFGTLGNNVSQGRLPDGGATISNLATPSPGTSNTGGLPLLDISDVTVTEGDAGTSAATFNVTLTAASAQTVTVNFNTLDGSATAPGDFVAASGP